MERQANQKKFKKYLVPGVLLLPSYGRTVATNPSDNIQLRCNGKSFLGVFTKSTGTLTAKAQEEKNIFDLPAQSTVATDYLGRRFSSRNATEFDILEEMDNSVQRGTLGPNGNLDGIQIGDLPDLSAAGMANLLIANLVKYFESSSATNLVKKCNDEDIGDFLNAEMDADSGMQDNLGSEMQATVDKACSYTDAAMATPFAKTPTSPEDLGMLEFSVPAVTFKSLYKTSRGGLLVADSAMRVDLGKSIVHKICQYQWKLLDPGDVGNVVPEEIKGFQSTMKIKIANFVQQLSLKTSPVEFDVSLPSDYNRISLKFEPFISDLETGLHNLSKDSDVEEMPGPIDLDFFNGIDGDNIRIENLRELTLPACTDGRKSRSTFGVKVKLRLKYSECENIGNSMAFLVTVYLTNLIYGVLNNGLYDKLTLKVSNKNTMHTCPDHTDSTFRILYSGNPSSFLNSMCQFRDVPATRTEERILPLSPVKSDFQNVKEGKGREATKKDSNLLYQETSAQDFRWMETGPVTDSGARCKLQHQNDIEKTVHSKIVVAKRKSGYTDQPGTKSSKMK